MATSVTEGGTQKLPKQNLRLPKPTDMTIHWKALEEQFRFNHVRGNAFSFFFSKQT
jgi:hypothetical protein